MQSFRPLEHPSARPPFSQSKLKKKLAPELEDASCNFVKIISYASGKKIGLWDFGAACCRSHKHGPSSDFYSSQERLVRLLQIQLPTK
jgi:hypothetical protein